MGAHVLIAELLASTLEEKKEIKSGEVVPQVVNDNAQKIENRFSILNCPFLNAEHLLV